MTGLGTTGAFLVTAGASLGFVLGGTLVFSAAMLTMAQPLALIVVFSTSSFVFIVSALMDLLPAAQGAFTLFLLHDSDQHDTAQDATATTATTIPRTDRALGQLFGIASLVVGLLLLYTVDAVLHRLSVLATKAYGSPGGPDGLRTRGSFTQIDMLASSSRYSPEARLALQASTGPGFSHLNAATDRAGAAPTIPELAAATESDDDNELTRTRRRASLLSALAVVLHHIPEGLALFVCASQSLAVGLAVGLGVLLHSVPDGTALASSIYFASGHRLRGLCWCGLAPVGKLLGAVLGWSLLRHGPQRLLSDAILGGIAAGVLLCVGVKDVLPTTHHFAAGKSHGGVLGIILGMLAIALTKFAS